MTTTQAYPHLHSVTVCPICGNYKTRQQVTCGHHELTPRALAIVADYEAALADRAKREAVKPMTARKAQAVMDIGLFSDDSKQTDLIDSIRRVTP